MLGLVLDEPTDNDHALVLDGISFHIDAAVDGLLERYYPLRVDHDPRFYQPLRVLPTRASCC